MCLFQNIPVTHLGQCCLNTASLMLGNQTQQRQYMLYIKSFFGVSGIARASHLEVCCTVNTMYYYYNCAVCENSFALGVQSRGFLPKDKRTKLAFHMKNDCTGFNLRIVFFFCFFVNCVIHHRMLNRRAPGDRDKVTDSLLGSS